MRRLAVALTLVACGADPPSASVLRPGRTAGPIARHTSSIAVSPDGASVYVVNADADSVSVIDAAARRTVREIALGAAIPAPDATGRYEPRVGPRALALSPGAGRLYVTGQRSGDLTVIDLASAQITRRVRLCAEPVGVLVSPDERSVFVACAMDAAVVRVDALTLTVTGTARTPAKPWSLAWSNDGRSLYASHLLGPGVSAIDPGTLRVAAPSPLPPLPRAADARHPNGEARGLYDVAPRPNSPELWVPHLLLSTETAQRPVREGSDVLELNFETTVFPALSVLGVDGARAAWMSVASMGVDLATRRRFGMQNITSGPHAIEFTPDGRWALVANANSDDVLVIDAERRVEAPQGLVRPLGGRMPEGIVVAPDGRRAWVDLRNTSSVAVLRLEDGPDGLLVTVDGAPIPRLARDPMPADLRLGQRVFFSANSTELPITQNAWVACASCHVEARSDAVTWRFKAGPRDTPSNAGGTLGTGPLLRTAVRATVADYWRIITEEQGGDGAAFRDDPTLRPALDALQAYVERAIPFPVPPTTDPARVARGREIFFRPAVGCATCHAGELFTDSAQGTLGQPRLHDVGSCNTEARWPDRPHPTDDGAPRESCRFDTPGLRGVADSAPYLHDGSAATLRDVLERTRGRMGNIQGLSSDDLDALVEYMRSL